MVDYPDGAMVRDDTIISLQGSSDVLKSAQTKLEDLVIPEDQKMAMQKVKCSPDQVDWCDGASPSNTSWGS